MQNRFNQMAPFLARISALVLAVCCLTACTSTGYQKGDVAAGSMRKAAAEVQAESRALDQVVTTLKDLVNEPGGDLRRPFQRYSKSLDHLIATAAAAQKTGKTVAQKSAAYLQDWNRQLQDIDYQLIHQLSVARQSEVTNRVEEINRRYQESQAVIQPLISYLLDIRKALSTDLTGGGLQTLKGVVQNANDNVAKVQTALTALSTELTNSSALMASVVPQTNDQHTQ